MQPKSRCRAVLLGGWSAMLILLTGCPRIAPTPSPLARPFQNVTVRVYCPNGDTARLVEEQGGSWAHRQGAKIQVVRDSTARVDARIIAPAELGGYVVANAIQPIPKSYCREDSDYGWQGLLPHYRTQLLVWGVDRTPYAFPIVGEVPLCFYRVDLFQPLEKEMKKRLVPPATWEEFAEAAEAYHRHSGGKAALPGLPASDDELDWLFCTIAASFARKTIRFDAPDDATEAEKFSFLFDSSSGEPRIRSAGFVQTLQLMQRLHQVSHRESLPGPEERFANGEAALCVADARWLHRFQEGKIKGKFGVCQVPGSNHYFAYGDGEKKAAPSGNWAPYLGGHGWLGVTPVQSTQPEAAFALLADLSSRDTAHQISASTQWGGAAIRRDQLDKASAWLSLGFDASRTQALLETVRQTLLHPLVKIPALRLRIPGQQDYVKALTEELRPAIEQNRSADETMATIAGRWKKLQAGKERTWLREYRLNLGLDPDPRK